MSVTSEIELYDSDIKAIDEGPIAWATTRQGTSMDVDAFVRTLTGMFDEIGLRTRVNTFDTTEAGTYAFEIVIHGRHEERAFDYDRMVHEVQSGMLLGEEAGTIKADPALMRQAAERQKPCH